MGLKPHEIYRCTLYELNIVARTFTKRQKIEQEIKVSNIHLQACLNSFAVNDPQKMPSLNKLIQREETEIVTDHEEIKKLVRAAGLPCPL